MKDKKCVFYYSLFIFFTIVVLFVNLKVEATSVVSNLNFSSNATDAVDRTVRGMATNSIDRLMSETIIPSLTNSSASRLVLSASNQTDERGSPSELDSINRSSITSKPINSSMFKTASPQENTANNARAIADNGTILLQFHNPTDLDIVNRLEKLETIVQEYIKRNEINNTATSIEESNEQIITELSEIKSSISGSSSRLLSGIISGALVAGIVSAVAVLVLLRAYSIGGIKISELKLRKRNN